MCTNLGEGKFDDDCSEDPGSISNQTNPNPERDVTKFGTLANQVILGQLK